MVHDLRRRGVPGLRWSSQRLEGLFCWHRPLIAIAYTTIDSRETKKRCRLLSCIMPASLRLITSSRAARLAALKEKQRFAPVAYISRSRAPAAMKRVRNERSTTHLPYRASRSCADSVTASHTRALASRIAPTRSLAAPPRRRRDRRTLTSRRNSRNDSRSAQDQDRLAREGRADVLRRLAARVPRVVAHGELRRRRRVGQ